jgi:hypothetical protein
MTGTHYVQYHGRYVADEMGVSVASRLGPWGSCICEGVQHLMERVRVGYNYSVRLVLSNLNTKDSIVRVLT